MQTIKRDNSMMIRSALGQALISRETAATICKMVVCDLYGADEYAAQAPVTIEESEGAWNLRGSRVLPAGATSADRGPLQMRISKLDGAILSFTL
jgi:hypothetical protein